MLKWHTVDNTLIVADFDRTITTWEPWCASAFWVFPRAPWSSKEIQVRAKRLFEKYYPIEINPSISEQERSVHMKKWNEEVYELLWDCVDESQFERILEYARENIRIRWWKREFLQELWVKWIPLIVVSAGVSNVIETVLDNNSIPYHTVQSNELWFHEGKLQLINEWVYIWHKWWNSLPNNVISSVSWRSHTLLLGDSLDDINMWDPNRITTSIGFLNSEQRDKWRKDDYLKAFDHVIESDDCDRGFLEEVSSKINV